MSDQDTFLDALVGAIQRLGSYNKNDQEPPVAILWPDKDRQWESLQLLLRERLPLFTLGDYKPEERTGPAYWLRCIIARTLPQYVLPPEVIPIIYLPGISKQEIRAIEETPKILQPLAELQYRGVLWTQKNGRDWTVSAFLQSTYNNGLGIELIKDTETKSALHRALLKLIDEPVVRLKKEAPLRAAFFDSLLHPDKVRNLLLWLNDATGYPKRCTADEWAAFCNVCQSEYSFHPEKDGVVTATTLLGQHQGAWDIVWNRFKDAPHAYPYLPESLRNARSQQPLPIANIEEAWPQDNEAAELALLKKLISLQEVSLDQIRTVIADLEQEHAVRRTWVWATLGRSPLAMALQHLMTLARETAKFLNGTTVAEIASAYTNWGWKADAAAIDALRVMGQADVKDVTAVKTMVMLLYRPWLEKSATALQKVIGTGYSAQTYPVEHLIEPDNGTCILFCDGLRYDVGQRLVTALESQELTCSVTSRLVALPTITPTAKPAISPIAKRLSGRASAGLEVMVTASNTKMTIDVLRKLLEQSGYQVLKNDNDFGDPSTKAWTEAGAIDHNGHAYSWRLVYHLQSEVEVLKQRIESLLNWGWKQVLVVTDHGWLLLPDSLPKAELPEHLTHMRKGRCAQLKELVYTDQQTLPWYWNNNVQIAYAPNICCYEAGKEYEHGGLSPQECIVPLITVAKQHPIQPVTIKNVSWRGLRCTMRIAGSIQSIQVDIRTKAGDPRTSLLSAPKSPNADGTVSVLIEDEERVGEAALIVALKSDGTVSKQILVTIGG